MDLFIDIFIILIVASCSCIVGEGRNKIDTFEFGDVKIGKTLNVFDFGAVGDGKADDTEAFSKAWEAVCRGNEADPILQVPEGKTFLLQTLKFKGPCTSKSVRIQISGTIVAPETLNAWKSCPIDSWLSFLDVSQLSIYGSGLIDGKGAAWWAAKKNGTKLKCEKTMAILFTRCDNLSINGLTHINSLGCHIKLYDCHVVSIHDIKIIAPKDSPNTDAIDIGYSSHVNIFDSFMGIGDDCVAISNGCFDINITNVNCGPGHGISVGSLGRNGDYNTVENVHVKNVTFNGSSNGARIKTWEGGSGYARKISFEDITLISVQNPIIIDQHYCLKEYKCKISSKAVNVSDVTFKNFNGTSATEKAINIDCGGTGCTNIVMEHVNIKSSDRKKKTSSVCKNAHGRRSSPIVPSMPCLVFKKDL